MVEFHGGPYSRLYSNQTNNLFKQPIQNGIDILNIDYFGTPGYGDEYVLKSKLGIAAIFDSSMSLIEKLENQNGKKYDKIYLSGSSFGGTIISYALQNPPANIDGVILINPLCKFTEEENNNLSDFRFWNQLLFTSIFKNSNGAFDFCKPDRNNIPTFVIVGIQDNTVKPSQGITIANSSQKSKIAKISDGGHELSLKIFLEQNEQGIEWIRKNSELIKNK